MIQIENIQKLGKDNMDATMKTFGALTKGAQAIAAETADYAKKSFEHGSATFEKLAGVRTLDKAIEVQTEYAKQAYESFVSQSTKMGELYANLAKEAFKPYEGVVSAVAARPLVAK